jgi:hypothetical protein
MSSLPFQQSAFMIIPYLAYEFEGGPTALLARSERSVQAGIFLMLSGSLAVTPFSAWRNFDNAA